MPHSVSVKTRLETSAALPAGSVAAPVLVVDLDGTLLKGDLLWESLLAYVFPAPWRAGQVLAWLAKGRAHLKARLAAKVTLEGRVLPWNEETVKFCEARAQQGVEVVIATASNQVVAEAVTDHFNFFSRVIASDESCNLKGERKAERLVADFGASGFDYVGDSATDLPVWKAARNAWFVGAESRGAALQSRLGKSLGRVSARADFSVGSFFAALRPHQWLKNLLVFFPVLAAHRWTDTASWRSTVTVFVALCCMASASYLLNDLSDLAADRRHARKKARSLASGQLAIPAGLIGMTGLLLLGVALAALAGPMALAATLAYFLLSVVYSLVLKTVPVLDAIFLSGLYTYRMVLGGVAASVLISPWLLAFSTTFFLGLAFLKRFVEIEALAPDNSGLVPRRGYGRGDLGFVLVAGVASSFLSVVVLALYLESSASRALYAEPQWLWGIALVMLFWIIRVWFLASRKQLHDDPVWFAAKDWVTFALALGCVAFVAAAHPV